jgi:hypothetical protein
MADEEKRKKRYVRVIAHGYGFLKVLLVTEIRIKRLNEW